MYSGTGKSQDYLTRTGSQALRIHRARGYVESAEKFIDGDKLAGAPLRELEEQRLNLLNQMDVCDRQIKAVGGALAHLRETRGASKRLPATRFDELKDAQRKRQRLQEALGLVNKLIRAHHHADHENGFYKATKRLVTPAQFAEIVKLADLIRRGEVIA